MVCRKLDTRNFGGQILLLLHTKSRQSFITVSGKDRKVRKCKHCGKHVEPDDLLMCGGPGCANLRCGDCLDEYSDPINPSVIMPLCDVCAGRVMEIYYAKMATRRYEDTIQGLIAHMPEGDHNRLILEAALYWQTLMEAETR